ncbi:anti-sigma factor [Sphingobium sp. AN641]|uniref:anti-sigma factor family protein n=1 Tax=Sphingobium sp. AN641 TaxID=3133443 RepID=UPI0030BCAEC8
MSDISEDMLIALCDGELDEVTRRRVERAIADDPALGERLAAHRLLRDRLSAHYAPVEQEPPPERFAALLREAAIVTPIVRPRSRRAAWAMGGAIAASLLLGIGFGRFSVGEGSPVAVRDGRMVAQGALASALDTQLAAAPGAVEIGVSFRRKGGGWCRSFDGADLAGVACRDGDTWQMQQLLPGKGRGTGYRQASSSDSRLAATVDALIVGDPADPQTEARARDGGWAAGQ